MKKNLFLATFLLSSQMTAFATEWNNPPVMCPEEILPKGIKCLDFTNVQDVYSDFPDDATVEEMKDWKNNKAADLRLCRNKEVLKREALKPGSYSPATIENAWMIVNGGEKVNEKLDAVTNASKKYGIPPQVLLGAMKQESLLSSLGVSPDGGNYSCGMSQLNIQEWCSTMNKLSTDDKLKYGWPTSISCESDFLPTTIVKPFYDLAILKLGTRKDYELTSEDFLGITSDQVISGFPSASNDIQEKRFQAVTSFVNHCQDVDLSIDFKAQTLKGLYNQFVPEAFKSRELYKEGETFTRSCVNAYPTNAYPLNTGWLLAVAMYNAGPSQSKLVGHYYQVKRDKFPSMNPLDLIEALHWGGKYKSGTDTVVFKDQNGDKFSQKWFKSCIVQRHVAKVIQHVTLPAESIAKSLEQAPCKNDGTVPEYRQKSSGVK